LRPTMWLHLLLFCALYAASGPKTGKRSYLIVIDAGSTGSRIHVYPYIPSKHLPTFFPNEEFTDKKKPGLSSFRENPSEAGDSLEVILQEAKDNLPSNIRFKEVPIFLVATAGLRKVFAVDPEATNQIMSSVRMKLRHSGFKFKDSWARIIQGTEEGVFGWVTVNYLLGNFMNADAKTTGVFEMGGESVQLAFLPKTPLPKDLPKNLITPMQIAGRTYNLFAHSWMGYGMEAVQSKFDDKIADESTTPCYLTGDVRHSTGSDAAVSFKGDGNWDACYLLLKDILREGKGNCEEQVELRCTLDGLQIPREMGDMVLIENF